MAFLPGRLTGAISCRYLHRLELLRQPQKKEGNSGHWTNGKATSSNRAPSTSSPFASTSHRIQPSIATAVSV